MKDKKVTYKNLFESKEVPLNEMEKGILFQKILKTGRRHKIRRLTLHFTIVVFLFGFGIASLYNTFYHEAEIGIVEISNKNKKLVVGRDKPILLSSDTRGYTLTLDSQNLNSQQQESLYQIDTSFVNNEGYTTVYIPYGNRKEIILPDESRVWLNAGSILTFNNKMKGDSRIAYLDGEGYFDIKKSGTSFSIYTHKLIVKVLGTSFNLSSYENDDFQTLDLLTGKVLLESITDDFSAFEVNPGERIKFSLSKNHIHINKSSKGDDILWTNKQLKLNKSSLPELFTKLNKIYNVEIVYHDGLSLSEPYSGRLNLDVDVVTALQSIHELKGYKIELRERKVYIDK